MVDELRRVEAPGKFEGGLVIDQYAYELSLQGCDEEVGEVDALGWYGLFRGPLCKADESPAVDGERLTDAEVAYMATVAGAIVCEDSPVGFVNVMWYRDAEELERDWATIVADCGQDGDEADDDGE
jgi:hypothetical protein